MARRTLWALSMACLLAGCSAKVQQTPFSDKASPKAALEAYTQLGLSYLEEGDLERAKSRLKRAMEIDDDSPMVYNAFALVFQQEGEYELAEEYFQEALDIDDEYSTGYNNYGVFLYSQRRYEEACKAFSVAAEDPLYERRPQALENLGSCYRALNRNQLAKTAFERVLRLSPHRSLPLIELADLHYQQGNLEEAQKLYARFADLIALKRAQHSAKSLWLGLRLAREQQDIGMAASYALLLKNQYPDSTEFQLYKESRQ